MSEKDGLQLRPLLREEIEPLAALLDEASAAQLENRWREQAMGYRELLLAERDGELLGTVSIAESESPPRSLHLFALEVASARRNQGVGGAVVGLVLDEARRRGREAVYLEVRVDNPARRLYQRMGFRRVSLDFVNAWWRFNPDGSRDHVEELSLRMLKRLR